MAKISLIISRKFQNRWSDLEVLILLHIGNAPATFMETVSAVQASESGCWNALKKLIRDGLIYATPAAGAFRCYYHLTAYGKTSLANFLS